MPLMRNPFRSSKNPADTWADENGEPIPRHSVDGFETTTDASGKTKPISVRSNATGEDQQPTEYKLCEINGSGVFLPPSPTEKKSPWSLGSLRSQGSSASTSTRNTVNENEPFSISRESFDSYRRSFDISARSPVMVSEAFRPRQSLDARRVRLPGPALKETTVNPLTQQPEDRFEDVGLNDEAAKPKKHSFLSRFGASSENRTPEATRPNSSGGGHTFFGRKRGQSGQGAELGSVQKMQQEQQAAAAAAKTATPQQQSSEPASAPAPEPSAVKTSTT